MVAASVSRGPDGSRITDLALCAGTANSASHASLFINHCLIIFHFRDTTMMPNIIRGFGTIMVLLFSPCVEFHTDAKASQYIGAICRLGYNKKSSRKLSHDKEQDMDIEFDVAISQFDVGILNLLRLHMNDFLSSEASIKEI